MQRYQQQQQQQQTDYRVAFVDANNNPIIWEDPYGRLFAFDNQNNWIEVDERGNPVMYNQPSVPPRMPGGAAQISARQNPTASGGRQYGSSVGGIGGNRQEPDAYGGSMVPRRGYGGDREEPQRDRYQRDERSNYRREDTPEPKKEVKLFSPTQAGYRPENGSEFIPFYDESKQKLIFINDEKTKTYKFILEDI